MVLAFIDGEVPTPPVLEQDNLRRFVSSLPRLDEQSSADDLAIDELLSWLQGVLVLDGAGGED